MATSIPHRDTANSKKLFVFFLRLINSFCCKKKVYIFIKIILQIGVAIFSAYFVQEMLMTCFSCGDRVIILERFSKDDATS
jgi:hypothetical protein